MMYINYNKNIFQYQLLSHFDKRDIYFLVIITLSSVLTVFILELLLKSNSFKKFSSQYKYFKSAILLTSSLLKTLSSQYK